LAIAHEVADEEVDDETEARGTNTHAEKWTIIPPKHAKRESTVKTTQTPAIQSPPETSNELATTPITQDTSKSDFIHFKRARDQRNKVVQAYD
jgi:hypothetical protein